MVLERIRKGLHAEPPVVAQLKAHQWTSEAHKKDLIEKFLAFQNPDLDDVVWTAVDPTPEIRTAGLALLKRHSNERAVLDALVPLFRTRSEAARRAVQRFMKELAGRSLGPFLAELAEKGDDFARLAVLELARELPPESAFSIFRRILTDPHPKLRARALRAASEVDFPGHSALVANLALPLLKDEDEEIRLAALATLERNPSEALISHVIQLVRSGGTRVVEASFSALQRLLPVAQADHSNEILPLLADGSDVVRTGAVALLQKMPAGRLVRGFVSTFRGAFVWVRDRALETAVAGLPNLVPELLNLTRDPDTAVAESASEMALSLRDPRAVPTWLALLSHPDWWIRNQSIECLGKFGKGRDDVLQRLLTELKDPEMALSAASAIGELGDPRGASPLFDLFKAGQSRPEDQLEILDAMARLGEKDPRVVNVFAKISALPEIHHDVRGKARRLVGRLQGDAARDALPGIGVAPRKVDLAAIPSPTIVDFLADTVARGASDFHLATGFVPHQRIHGTLHPMEMPVTAPERAEKLIREVLSPEDWNHLQKDRQIDLCLKVPGLGRFRANFFSQRGGFDASFRAVPASIPTLDGIGLPESVWEVTRYTQGLVLVTGPAGCGKSTTLAALVNRINESQPCHIITIEDPIEYVHPNKEALVNQRQVPHHTASFARALKAALREDPDVILVGEMRDLETIALAISASETGHLVFGTLNTTTSAGTIDRIINSFPAGQQGQIRTMLSDSLKAVISQSLLSRRGGEGRVAAFEILRGTPAISALIRDSKTFQIASALQTGQLSGMNTMDQALLKLAEEGKVDLEVAVDRAIRKEPFEKLLNDERMAFA